MNENKFPNLVPGKPTRLPKRSNKPSKLKPWKIKDIPSEWSHPTVEEIAETILRFAEADSKVLKEYLEKYDKTRFIINL